MSPADYLSVFNHNRTALNYKPARFKELISSMELFFNLIIISAAILELRRYYYANKENFRWNKAHLLVINYLLYSFASLLNIFIIGYFLFFATGCMRTYDMKQVYSFHSQLQVPSFQAQEPEHSCDINFHSEEIGCVYNFVSCPIINGTGTHSWNGTSYDSCTLTSCDAGYHANGNVCEADAVTCDPGYHANGNNCDADVISCYIPHSTSTQTWNGSAYGACNLISCDDNYQPYSNPGECEKVYSWYLLDHSVDFIINTPSFVDFKTFFSGEFCDINHPENCLTIVKDINGDISNLSYSGLSYLTGGGFYDGLNYNINHSHTVTYNTSSSSCVWSTSSPQISLNQDTHGFLLSITINRENITYPSSHYTKDCINERAINELTSSGAVFIQQYNSRCFITSNDWTDFQTLINYHPSGLNLQPLLYGAFCKK